MIKNKRKVNFMSVCDEIAFDEIYIDETTKFLKMQVKVKHNHCKYAVFFNYDNNLKTWSIRRCYHSEPYLCKNCKEHVKIEQQDDIKCHYMDQFKESIESEVLNNAIIKEKINNFRLEAITAGYNY
jgi:hypothetical protein